MKQGRIFLVYINMALLFGLSGCVKPQDRSINYPQLACQEELLEGNDFDPQAKIDAIVIDKAKRKMYLYRKGDIVDTLPVSLGQNPVGAKRERGDMRTPEGTFWIHRKLCSKKYYRSLCISYPLPQDQEKARLSGKDLGGDITIHAQPKWNADGHADSYTLSKDWTQGCIAVTNSAMDRLWYAVREGVPVTIK